MTMRTIRNGVALLLTIVCLSAQAVLAQPTLEFPRVSQQAKVSQRVGLTDITIKYHRPLVKDRLVWGGIVPYGEVWRTGANENTTITFSGPVSVEGHELPAGTYGLHTIPAAQGNWTLVLSHNNHLWGSFRYQEDEDALRVPVTPRPASHQEVLLFSFPEVTDNSTTVVMHWAELAVPIRIEVDTEEAVMAQLRKDIRGLAGFFPQSLAQAAGYTLQANTHHEEGMAWIDQAIQRQPTFANYSVKAGLLAQLGREAEAEALISEHMATATENEVNTYGYQLLGAGQLDSAIEIFKHNVEANPDSWNTYDSLAEAYAAKGETAKSIEFYEKALSMVQDEVQQSRINGVLQNLRGSN